MSEDMRRLIKNNFIKLYSEGGLRIANVKKICEVIPISRTTFYAYFPDSFSVLEEIQDEIINDLYTLNKDFPDTDLRDCKRDKPVKCFDNTLNYINNNRIYLAALLGEFGDGQFIYKWKKIIKYHFKKKYEKEFLHYEYIDLAVEQISSSIIGAYSYWVFNQSDISIEDFSRVCFPKICFDFISV